MQSITPLDLRTFNATLRQRGLRLLVEQRRQALTVRGTFPEPDGSRRRKRLPLHLQATPANLLTAELRCLELHQALAAGTFPAAPAWLHPSPPPRPVTPSTPSGVLTCGAAIDTLRTSYWESRPLTSAAQRTWDRIANELRRLPTADPCTLEVLRTAALTTPPGSRSRGEACKVYLRLARLLCLSGDITTLSNLQGHYTPKPRHLPEDGPLLELLHALRPTPFGWCYAAMATFGCRPAEIPSLVLGGDGTAQCLTVKRRLRQPVLRTTFALPPAWIATLSLHDGAPPGDTRWTHPEDYDSATARRFVDAWRHSRRSTAQRRIFDTLAPEFDLLDLRHRWAVRSIEAGLPLTLCARALGHSAAVHEATYHRWLTASDLRGVMSALTASL